MILDRTLPTLWPLRAGDVPRLAGRGRDEAVLVGDTETLCASIVVDQSRRDADYAAKELADLYDSLGWLLGRVVEVLPVYDPTRGRQVHDPFAGGFKGWLHLELTCDLIDYWRAWFGRHGQKRVFAGDSKEDAVDGPAAAVDDGYDGRSYRERRSRGALDEAAGDRGDAWLDALRGRLLEGRDRALLREVEALGLGTVGGARGRTAAAGGVGAFEPIELLKVAA